LNFTKPLAPHPNLGETVPTATEGEGDRMDDVTALALAARDGDHEALAEVVRRTQADVWRFCAHLAGHGQADDLTQEVYARALKSLRTFRGDAAARLWLLAIARRTCADHVRTEVRRRRLADHLLGHARRRGPRTVDDVAETHSLTAVIETLPPDYRSAFTLTQVLGLSYAETASVCDCPVGTVRSRVARARETVIRELAAGDAAVHDGTADG
jgi:RNA polymerase sigma-70 factor (ECF subfamily)